MREEFKIELKIWLIYFATIFFSSYIHEIGHCIPAWINGYGAIPTPAKEYVSSSVPVSLTKYISLGGIICSILFTITILIAYLVKSFKYSSVLLAGAIAVPGLYTLRFLLTGRGHDATEFQETQSVMGFDYSGHFLDWIFLTLFLTGAILWIIKSKPRIKVGTRLLIGGILTLIFVIGLQSINNLVFDPIFNH
jgi:hypothetical protein